MRLKCLVNVIGGRSGGWIPPGGELFGELVGGGMNCLGKTEDGLRKFSGYHIGVLVAFCWQCMASGSVKRSFDSNLLNVDAQVLGRDAKLAISRRADRLR